MCYFQDAPYLRDGRIYNTLITPLPPQAFADL